MVEKNKNSVQIYDKSNKTFQMIKHNKNYTSKYQEKRSADYRFQYREQIL